MWETDSQASGGAAAAACSRRARPGGPPPPPWPPAPPGPRAPAVGGSRGHGRRGAGRGAGRDGPASGSLPGPERARWPPRHVVCASECNRQQLAAGSAPGAITQKRWSREAALALSSCFCLHSGGSGRVGGSRPSGPGALGPAAPGTGRPRGVFRSPRLRPPARLAQSQAYSLGTSIFPAAANAPRGFCNPVSLQVLTHGTLELPKP